MSASSMAARERVKARGRILPEVTQNFDDVTVSDNGDSNQSFEEVLDLSPDSAGITYVLFDGMKVRFDPDDSGNSDLPDSSEVQFYVQGPQEERGGKFVIREVTVGRFNANSFANQFDQDTVFELGVSTPDGDTTIDINEDEHFKIGIRGATAISWSDSRISFELGEVT